MQANYEKQMEVLEEAMQQPDCGPPLTPEELDQLVQRLYTMKHNGKLLMEMMETSQSAAESCFTEKLVQRNSSFTTVKRQPKKKKKLINDIKQMFKQKSVKSDGRKRVENNNNGISSKQVPPNKPLPSPPVPRRPDPSVLQSAKLVSGSKFLQPSNKASDSLKQKPAGDFNKNSVRKPEKVTRVKEPAPQPPQKKTPAPSPPGPPPKASPAQAPAPPPPPPPPPQLETNNNDVAGDHALKPSLPEMTQGRASLLEDIRKRPKLKVCKKKYQLQSLRLKIFLIFFL